jgi:alkylation response protein AidB-like acyl-CoA dehydrogenase
MAPIEVARALGNQDDPRIRELVGEAMAIAAVHKQMVERVSRQLGSGALPPAGSSMLRLLQAEGSHRREDICLQIAGANAATGIGSDPGIGGRVSIGYLMRQSASLGGGTTEISRNIISERLLGMPREPAMDRDVPFKEVKRGR